MSNFNNYDLLEIVEEFANINGLISSEYELTKLFNTDILPLVIEQYSPDDDIAINEGFKNWSDSLCKDGYLHEEQYNNYCYLGVQDVI